MRPHFRTRFAALALTLTTLTSAAPVGAAGGFSDVEADRWFTTPISWMAAEGITTGTSSTTFSPGVAVTRAQFVTLLWRPAGSPGGNPAPGFSDGPTGRYFTEAVAWARAEGVTTGTSATMFSPEIPLTRAQAAALVWREAGRP